MKKSNPKGFDQRSVKHKNNQKVVLITVTGDDRPGITASISKILADAEANILDLGQSVIHGLLSLSILFELSPQDFDGKSTLKDLLFQAAEMNLKLQFQMFEKSEMAKSSLIHANGRFHFHYAVTVLGDLITARTLHQVCKILYQYNLNIDFIERLSDSEFNCIELQVSSVESLNESLLKKKLLLIAKQEHVDIALQSEGLFRRAKRLIVMDMDSTLIQNEVIDEMARVKGCYEQVQKITHEAMAGKLDYDESLGMRVEKLAGLTIEEMDKIFQNLKITPGAEELVIVLKKLGYKIAIISGGFQYFANRLKQKLNIDFAFSNQLEMKNNVLTGKVIPPVVNALRKADLLTVIAQQESIALDQVIAVGDGANDILMLEKAGLGIAFNAKPIVENKADFSMTQKNLKSILYLLGIPSREINAVLSKSV